MSLSGAPREIAVSTTGGGRRLALGITFAVALGVGAFLLGWKLAIWPLNQRSEAALARRAQQFWDLKLAGDTLGAYQLMAESYRRRVSPSGFARQGGGLVIHTGATVRATRIDEAGGQVEIDLRHILNKEHFESAEATSTVTERWVFENGGWYRWPPG